MFKIFTLLFIFSISNAQFHIGAKFIPKKSTTKPDSAYFGDIGIRGAWISNDIDKDGKPELLITDYTKRGRVHAFQAVGNDTLEWIWSSPILNSLGANSTPRTIRSGDLDGDGKGEIIFPVNGYGFFVYEWDGVIGSHKFGNKPSALIPKNVQYGPSMGSLSGIANEGNLQFTVENFEVMDVDKDGAQELITPKNLTAVANDDYLIISAVGTWDFEEPGFSSFQIEASTRRTIAIYGGGSPYGVHPADLNGDGKNEIVFHNWNFGNYWVAKTTNADTLILPPIDSTWRYFYQTINGDNVALFGGAVADLDNDGNQEVYFPWYGATAEGGDLFMVDYKSGDNVLQADSNHSFKVMEGVSLSTSGAKISSFYGVESDLDRNGKKEILVGSAYPSNVVAVEFNGGDIRLASNYTRKVFYTGENNYVPSMTFKDSIVYRDSIGLKKDTTVFKIKDSTSVLGEGFVSKITKPIDFDGDTKLEVFLPYQSVVDTFTVRTYQRKYTWLKYKNDTVKWVQDSIKSFTDSTIKISNPKKWGVRSLETDIAGSVDGKDRVIITPDDFILNNNYPNPFNPSTKISFELPLNKIISLIIFDVTGKEIRSLEKGKYFTKGNYTVEWNGKNNSGKTVPSGIYFCQLQIGNLVKSIKMNLVK